MQEESKIMMHVHTMTLALKPKVIFGVQFRTQIMECPISDSNHRVKTPEPKLRILEQCLNPDQGAASCIGQFGALGEHGNQSLRKNLMKLTNNYQQLVQ